MPKAFDNCVKRGGTIKTVNLDKTRYRHICIINGKAYKGHIKRKAIKINKGKGN